MSENKYESRVRQRAEEMYNAARSILELTTPIQSDEKEEALEKLFIPLARLSVQREAEAYIKANEAHYAGPVNMNRVKEELQSLGLVPENEPGNDPGNT